METAKVDIRKLQMLNDCINRTIEALNQVRMSVHGGGLSHSAPYGMQSIGTPAFMGGYPGAFASPYAALAPQMMGMMPGIGHTAASAYASPFAGSPLAYWASQQSPFAQQTPWTQQTAWTQQSPWTQTGLGHTAVDSRPTAYEYATDPYVTARIAQTFPFVHWGYSPFGWPSI